MNYGHALRFGALTRRTELIEELGYDLAMVPEWTGLAWLAGRTDRVGLVGRADLTEWNAAVLGRSAAGLDLLSGGRVALTLGTSGDVAALAEAIDVIRAIWDTSAPRVTYDGAHHRLDGAESGPEPAHALPIWVTGDDPAVLELAGRQADGWVFAHDPERPECPRTGNKLVDEAALAAGRDPREIRRILVVTGDVPASVLDDGFGTIVLRTDDEAVLTRFARETIPALRAAAPDDLSDRPVRPAAVLARRRAGIDYDGVPESLAATAVEPGDRTYGRVRSNYLRGGSPGLLLFPRDTAGVADALAFARRHPRLPLGVRSGGHGVSGRSTNDGGIVVDLRHLNAIEVLDETTRRVRIGPGARWKEVAAALRPYGWAIGSGDYGGVGVGGLATAGGIGFLSRKHGLTVDRLRAVEIVLADGSVVRADDHENADLFWAVRGAGANFGIVTSFEFEADEVTDVGWAQLVMDAADQAGFLRRFGEVASAAPRDTTAFLIMGPPRRGQPAVAQIMAMVDSGDPEVIVDQLQPFAGISALYQQQVVVAAYADVMDNAHDGDHQGQGEPVARSAFVREITPAFAAAAAKMLASGVVFFFQIRTVGGAVADVPADATAYAHRDAGFQVTAMGIDDKRMDALWEASREHFDGLYLSFETGLGKVADAFPPRTLDRLRALKRRYDPSNVFRDNFNIRDEK
ncbi:LLM class flavin-dependent oxidoreductase [Herbidospora galbida]|uniref:LLM class flavin-dependent oxidoreductase n=1 Tax=Herbidospora galbida TaxID=2575442 RepID=A0A4U3MLN7_9ACTN|nr:LLM class flavin-dependent oxidoreductase [Herbidospora galbida]TKK90455.1 LLM class flavin-dependent oxidoreductase [Herbidospora galbida]